MTKAQAQDLATKLLNNDVLCRVSLDLQGQYHVLAWKPGDTVTSATMTTIANSVTPSVPAVVARTSEVEFV